MAANDDRVARGPRRDHVDRYSGELLDPTEVGLGFGRQLLVRSCAGRRLRPAVVGFVDRLAFTITIDQERWRGDLAAVELVADAYLDFRQSVEHVELRHAKSGEAVRERGAAHEHRVEPAATARPT